MAWAHVQSVGAFTTVAGTTRALAYGSNTASGNLLIATCLWIGGSATTATCALTDTQTNTWTPIASTLSTRSPGRCQVFSAPAGTGANTVTMTTSASVSERVIIIGEFSGLSGSLGAGATVGNGSSTNPSINITVDAATSLVVGVCFTNSTASEGSGYSLLGTVQDGNVGEYRLPAGTGAQAVAFVQAVSAVWAIGAAEFLASAGGGGGTTVKNLAALGVG